MHEKGTRGRICGAIKGGEGHPAGRGHALRHRQDQQRQRHPAQGHPRRLHPGHLSSGYLRPGAVADVHQGPHELADRRTVPALYAETALREEPCRHQARRWSDRSRR
ncbi:hypothetical protein LSH36_322g01000 [Paralvinella palmiformis]|uniref:Uncharacterized protein n=1 Tax=Paralvinella palmiformis TaxID=53620 RepID=A0AAD9JHB2_9ANNE|nr:hypothetical protein LSH36_322g01000 [Paralvinella palmiformis]